MNDLGYQSLFSKEKIRKRAEEFWNEKPEEMKIKSGIKYKHLFDKETEPPNWNLEFSSLSPKQQNIIIKGELIRTYDNLPNIDKTCIKREYKLSVFSSKWFKLPKNDKSKLIKKLI